MDEKRKWDSAADEFQRTVGNSDPYTRKVLAYLDEKGAVEVGTRAADIGCGAGKYAVEFAKRGMRLLLIDISDKMMVHTLRNIAPYAPEADSFVGDFLSEALPPRERRGSVNLAFASMSPPALCPDGIARMSEMSARHCFLATYANRGNLLFAELRRRLGLDTAAASESYEGEYLALESAIRSLGFKPELQIVDHDWSDELSPAELTRRFFSGRMLSFAAGETDERRVRALLEDMSDSRGLVRSETKARAAWLYWAV